LTTQLNRDATHREGNAVPLEPLELGYLLVSERPRLTALAGGLSVTPEVAGAAVRRSLRTTWLAREAIETRAQLLSRLYGQLEEELRPGPET